MFQRRVTKSRSGGALGVRQAPPPMLTIRLGLRDATPRYQCVVCRGWGPRDPSPEGGRDVVDELRCLLCGWTLLWIATGLERPPISALLPLPPVKRGRPPTRRNRQGARAW